MRRIGGGEAYRDRVPLVDGENLDPAVAGHPGLDDSGETRNTRDREVDIVDEVQERRVCCAAAGRRVRVGPVGVGGEQREREIGAVEADGERRIGREDECARRGGGGQD